MHQLSPLNLTKEISIMDDAINSLLEMGKPESYTSLWAQIEILKERRELMRDGVGFSSGYSHVSNKTIERYLRDIFIDAVRVRLAEIVKKSEVNSGSLEFPWWIGGSLPKAKVETKFYITGYRTLKLYYSKTGRSKLCESTLICQATPDTAVELFAQHITKNL